MRLTFCWFGYELDVTLGPTTVDDEACTCTESSTETRGDVLSTPVGFTRPHIPWDADGPVHQFDPDCPEDE